ncbi:MAG TPA: hypothetical protein PLF32_06200 [Bacteroidales bacterium]|nr:hypothetical protein [Bacteroidales bacterium]HOR82229.1 hypothetical protein [Bacteroidales bacterium]HPJ91559.1 hypothetical protein [Bacteroidales bacterium]
MKILTPINLLLIITFLACNSIPSTDTNQNDSSIKDTNNSVNAENSERILSADKASVGMTINELKKAYPNAKFVEEPVSLYGVDGEGKGLVVVNNNERLLFVWTLEGDDKIRGITILSPSIVIDSNVAVGMPLQEFHKKYPDIKLTISLIDEDIEYCYVKGKEYLIEFLTQPDNRVGEYEMEGVEAESIRILRPDAKIDRISLY